MVTRKIFAVFVGLLALQRLAELVLSRRNEKNMAAQGGREFFPVQLRLMKVLHSAWLAGMVGEVFALRRPFIPPLAAAATALFAAGQLLRYAAIVTLGRRWTVKVMAVPGAPLVDRGIYQFVRHPNYLGVALEIAAAPLLHSAYWTAAIFTILNGLLLSWRIRSEEQVLAEVNQYQRIFAGRNRLLPWRRGR